LWRHLALHLAALSKFPGSCFFNPIPERRGLSTGILCLTD
jgi:hypothetical protein